MEFRRLDAKTVQLLRMRAPLGEFLRRIAVSADPAGNDAARARLFPMPSHDAHESEFVEDWLEFVQPELKQLFQSSLETIARDLRSLAKNDSETETSLNLPVAHLDHWIHGLNQARLALSARYRFGEEEMEKDAPPVGGSRALAFVQVRFYGFLQELFLHELEEP